MTASGMVRRAAGAAAGFTLIETLVALTLVALLVGSVLQALRWVGTASGFGRRAERAVQVQAGATAFMDLLAGALPGAPGTAGFVGDATAFSFDGVSDGTAVPPGRIRISLGFQGGTAGGALVVTIRPVTGAGPGDASSGWTTVLIDGVTNGRFSYFGTPGERAPAAWSTSWSTTSGQPSLVLVDLALEGLPTLPVLPLYTRVGRGPAIPAADSRR